MLENKGGEITTRGLRVANLLGFRNKKTPKWVFFCRLPHYSIFKYILILSHIFELSTGYPQVIPNIIHTKKGSTKPYKSVIHKKSTA